MADTAKPEAIIFLKNFLRFIGSPLYVLRHMKLVMVHPNQNGLKIGYEKTNQNHNHIKGCSNTGKIPALSKAGCYKAGLLLA
jgi:hypothetical protein